MAVKESTHWYDRDGLPHYKVIGANGKERNTTLRDARKLDLLPSVTSIIKTAAAPGLEQWKINQACLACLTLPKVPGESLDQFMKRAKQDAVEQAVQAAARGTEIHAAIESGFATGAVSTEYAAALRELTKLFPDADPDGWVAEASFSVDVFGGKVDLYQYDPHSRNLIVVDFKTKEFIKDSDPKKLVYDEHGMQLAAYAVLIDENMPQEVDTVNRVSIFIDRTNTSCVKSYLWDNESGKRHWKMFENLLNYWYLMKNF